MWWPPALREEIARLEVRLESAREREADLRQRLDRTERAFERLRDQALTHAGAIRKGLRDEANTPQKPNGFESAIQPLMAAVSVTEVNRNARKGAEEAER